MTDEVDTLIADATTFLFVPGDRPERFGKAFDSTADLVIIDLEDAVAPENKPAALAATLAALNGEAVAADFRTLVRTNGTPEEIRALSTSTSGRLVGVVIPKAEDPRLISAIAGSFDESVSIIALIETARGLAAARDIAAVPRVERIAFGAIDFAADTDSTSPILLDVARAELVLASRIAEIPAPIESPSTTFTDLDVVTLDARHARALGFGGKLCIHPAQLAAVSAGFAPTDDDIAWANRVVAVAHDGATAIDGTMIDKPVIDRARQILARATSSAR